MTETAVERAADAERPVVACYCATFLKPEMLHIYRQITALQRFRPVVIARKRELEERFPFPSVTLLKKSPTHWLRRIWYKDVLDAPWQISQHELRTLLQLLDRANAALAHIYFGHIGVQLLPLIQTWTRPVVVSFHGADVMVDMKKKAFRYATVQMLHKVDMVLVRSESLRDALVHLGCNPQKIRLHRAGIPLQAFPFSARAWPTDGQWRLVQACRLIEKKGLKTSLRAFAFFAAEFPDATFTIAGEGPQLDELKALASELGVTGKVIFPGLLSQSHLRELYEAAHFFLHPSHLARDGNQEGVPNAMLEAMASGLPVFATRHGGIPEAIEHGVSGSLVAEHDHQALAEEMISAARAPANLSSLARAGAEAVREKFEQTQQVRRLEDCYFEALGNQKTH